MSETLLANGPAAEPVEVPLSGVERELSRRLKDIHGDGQSNIHKARMSNLVIYCNDEAQALQVRDFVPAIMTMHPARVIALLAIDPKGPSSLRAWVQVRAAGQESRLCSEQVILRGNGHAAEGLPFAMRGLLIGDLPTNVWWASTTPPPLAPDLLENLADSAQQLIYDSLGWHEPHKGIWASSTWLAGFERAGSSAQWRVASDLNWRRLKYWRRLISQELSPAINPGALDSINEVLIEHGPHAVTQAWQLAGWLASRLGWKTQATKFKQGQEIAFQILGPHGPLRLKLDRLPDGPSQIQRVRFACSIAGKAGALDFVASENCRLSVQAEGVEAAPRTVTVKPQSIAELVARQLSDREPDSVFRDAMMAAHPMAYSLSH